MSGRIVVAGGAPGAGAAGPIEVTTLDVTGPGSITEALALAETNPGPDTITFAPSVTGVIEVGAADGPLRHTGPLTIIGPGRDLLRIRQMAPFPGADDTYLASTLELRGIDDAEFGTYAYAVTVSGLTISGSEGNGLLVDRAASVDIDDFGAVAVGRCGVQLGGGDATLSGVSVVDSACGVSLWSETTTLTDSSFRNLSTVGVEATTAGSAAVCGVEIVNATTGVLGRYVGGLLVSDSVVSGNTEAGVLLDDAGNSTVIVENSTLSGNGVGFDFGESNAPDVSVIDSTVSDGDGDGIHASGGALAVVRTTISGNAGHPILAEPAVNPQSEYVTFFDPGTVSISDSTIDRNGASLRLGGVEASSIINSTIAENSTQTPTLEVRSSSLEIRHTTMSSNVPGPGTPVIDISGFSDVYIDHSIVAANNEDRAVDLSATSILQRDHNLAPSMDLAGPNGTVSDAPALAGLADNGGATETMLPDGSSPAIDAGADASDETPTFDQRGGARLVGSQVDIGSVEAGQEPPGPSSTTPNCDVGRVTRGDHAERPPLAVTARSPRRLLDTRDASGMTAGSPLAAGTVLELDVEDLDGYSFWSAAALNVTAVRPQGNGFATVFPCGVDRPETSSLNFSAGVNLGNEILARKNAAGKVCLYVSATTHLTVDKSAVVEDGSPLNLIVPERLFDSRPGKTTVDEQGLLGRPVRAGEIVRLPIAGRGSVGPDAANAVVNTTAVRPTSNGFVTAWACDEERPETSVLNYTAGVTRGNEVMTGVSSDGELCLYSSSDTDLTVDVAGWSGVDRRVNNRFPPVRLLDTRTDGGVKVTSTTILLDGFERIDLTAATVNVTAVQPEGAGYLSYYPGRCRRINFDLTSVLNFQPGENGGNEIIVRPSIDFGLDPSEFCILSSVPTHLTVDLTTVITD